MDAPEDREFKLQKASSDLLSEFQTSLAKFLFKDGDPQLSIDIQVRGIVRYSTTDDLIQLLNPFQEWPELLDPHLSVLLPPLIDAFLEYLKKDAGRYFVYSKRKASYTKPLPRAVSEILYTLCKVRGTKVITRFFNNEPRYLQPLLDAFDLWSEAFTSKAPIQKTFYTTMVWQERYVMMLWLSHLMLTPFDLSSIGDTEYQAVEALPIGLKLPPGLPPVAVRIISIGVRYVVSAGKEREAAVRLLVRLSLRPDMVRLGLLDLLIQWALSVIKDEGESLVDRSVYTSLGMLSFVANTITSADANVIDSFLFDIMNSIRRLIAGESRLSKETISSALARKSIIKVYREISIKLLLLQSSGVDTVLEEVIEYLLITLADKDAPVRQAASKAIGMITASLEPSMAAEIVEAVVANMDEDVLWVDVKNNLVVQSTYGNGQEVISKERNLATVNALRWQGLTLTLSHVLFRRSPLPEQLPTILNCLILALGFEQRSSAGTSLGTNVRDAACFGIWSLARRYTTEELLRVEVSTVIAAGTPSKNVSILQIMANELVVAASLDPAGNIRRGASAALQELIGRHPDTICEGIGVVQVVDYHAVALRSKALKEVSVSTAGLNQVYWDALLNEIMKWRGICAQDANSRRLAAEAVGLLCSIDLQLSVPIAASKVHDGLKKIGNQDVDARHGLLLTATAIVNATFGSTGQSLSSEIILAMVEFWNIFKPDGFLTREGFTASHLRPDLTAEGACLLMKSLATAVLLDKVRFPPPSNEVLDSCVRVLELSLLRSDEFVVRSASDAARSLLELLIEQKRTSLATEWIEKIAIYGSAQFRGGIEGLGYIAALGAAYPIFEEEIQSKILDTIVLSMKPSSSIETKVASLRSLGTHVLPNRVINIPMIEAITLCLKDYTTDQRGDIGSLVRTEAINTVHVAWRYSLLDGRKEQQDIFAAICGLAAEKIHKVRLQAWLCLRDMWIVFGIPGQLNSAFSDLGHTSSIEYFGQITRLFEVEWVRTAVLNSYVTSAGVGSESILCSSRAALAAYLEQLSHPELLQFCDNFLTVLKQGLTNERLLLPILEVLGYLLETGILDVVKSTEFKWRSLFILVHKAHFKSSNVPKLLAAVNVYTGLSRIDCIRDEVMAKVANMLLHPFPKVRVAVAEALYTIVQYENIAQVDWTKPPKLLKENVLAVQKALKT